MTSRVPGDSAVVLSVHLNDHEIELQRKLKAAAGGQECARAEAGIFGVGEGAYLL